MVGLREALGLRSLYVCVQPPALPALSRTQVGQGSGLAWLTILRTQWMKF